MIATSLHLGPALEILARVMMTKARSLRRLLVRKPISSHILEREGRSLDGPARAENMQIGQAN